MFMKLLILIRILAIENIVKELYIFNDFLFILEISGFIVSLEIFFTDVWCLAPLYVDHKFSSTFSTKFDNIAEKMLNNVEFGWKNVELYSAYKSNFSFLS